MTTIKHIATSAVLIMMAACTPQSGVQTDSPPETPAAAEATVTPSKPRLYYECLGEGSPTIIIESGMGVAGTDQGSDGNWLPVMQGIEGTTRICAYDRVNTGRSAREPAARTSQDIVDDLQAMLTTEGIDGPYILLGHSMGGFHVRLFADQYPDKVVGMLLLDSTHPDHFVLNGEVFPTPSPDEPASWAQLRHDWTDPELFDVKPQFEYFDFAASADQVRETGPFGDLPLIVLAMDPTKYDLPPEIAAAIAIADEKAQRDLASLSTYTQGQYTIVPDSGHFIYINKPRAVIDALLELITAARVSQ